MLHPMYSEAGELCDTKNPMRDVVELLESIDAQRVPYAVL